MIDLSSPTTPALYVVENEIAKHDPMNHIAVQVLQFSLSFKNDPHRVKKVLKEILNGATEKVRKQCDQYASTNNYGDTDNLLSKLVYEGDFRALVIVDELDEDLEIVPAKQFRFQAEVITIARFTDKHGNHVYEFEPFLSELAGLDAPDDHSDSPPIDVSEIDTIIVPAREDGFQEAFIGEDRWYAIRIHASMIPKIKYIAAYRVAPMSAVTHIAEVSGIEQWQDSGKYVVDFLSSAQEIKPIPWVENSKAKFFRGPRYTSRARLLSSTTLDEVFEARV